MLAKKQPQVIKIPSNMVHKLYCRRYLSIQNMIGEKKKKTNISKHIYTLSNFSYVFFTFPQTRLLVSPP